MYTATIDAFGQVCLDPYQDAGYAPGITVCISLTRAGSILITVDDTPVLVEAEARSVLDEPRDLDIVARPRRLARGCPPEVQRIDL
jgi:hypothetical protein